MYKGVTRVSQSDVAPALATTPTPAAAPAATLVRSLFAAGLLWVNLMLKAVTHTYWYLRYR
eukprot:COSAG02_NODE_54347_length_296_cov_1.213198_2_plen_60_part_01